MSLERLIDEALPLNRKERFYTGTVLPALVCAENMAHLDRFIEHLGIPDVIVDADPKTTNVQFFTEYGFLESVFGAVRDRFSDIALGRDTPDAIIYLAGERPHLIAIEGKMYDVPNAAELERQISVQGEVCAYIASKIGAPAVHQVLLIPAQLHEKVGEVPGARTVTWQELNEMYGDVAPPYFAHLLQIALDRYDDLVSLGTTFGRNADGKLTGSEIYQGAKAGSIAYTWMGRRGGLYGPDLSDDISTGEWAQQQYEVRVEPLEHNQNWFPISAFLARLKENQSPTP